MKYETFINSILKKRPRFMKNKKVLYERHHIIPKCVGGTNEETNLIDLLPREHFIAHKLLAEENSDNKKLIYPFWMFCKIARKKDIYNATPEEYEKARKLWIRALKKTKQPEEVKQKISKTLKENIANLTQEERREKFGKGGHKNKGLKRSKKTRDKISKSVKENEIPYIRTPEINRKSQLNSSRKCPIEMYDENENYIQTFISIAEARRVTGLNLNNIHKPLQTFEAYQGYKWKYVNKPKKKRRSKKEKLKHLEACKKAQSKIPKELRRERALKNPPLKGKHLSDFTKKKLSKKLKGKKPWNKGLTMKDDSRITSSGISKAVDVYDSDNNFIATFSSVSQLLKNINKKEKAYSLHSALEGKRKYWNGYIVKYHKSI